MTSRVLRRFHLTIVPLGIIFLTPLVVVIGLFVAAQIIQSQEFSDKVGIWFQEHAALSFIIAIAAPFLAFVLNISPLFKRKIHAANVIIAVVALAWFVFMFGHDSIPCFLNRVVNDGFRSIFFDLRDCIRNS